MSRPYKPDPAVCCEACVFGRGEHARWCYRGIRKRLGAEWAAEVKRLTSAEEVVRSCDAILEYWRVRRSRGYVGRGKEL